MKHSIRLIITMVLIFTSVQIMAAGKKYSVNGRIKQGSSALVDLDNQGVTNGPTNYLAEVKWSWRPSRQWTFIANGWLRGDFAPKSGDFLRQTQGIKSPFDATPGALFRNSLPYHVNRSDCTGSVTDTFCSGSHEQSQFNDLNEILRELSVKYRDKKNRFTIKVGKQQRGWGQSDGLRLMDLLHAQDLRERFAFRDSDELRVPAFMVSADFNLRKMGLAGAFESLGMKRPILEINVTPEVHHSRFNINNPNPSTAGGASGGGAFGLPYPDVYDPVSGAGYVGFGFDIREKTSKRWSLDDAEYSARLKFDTLGGQATINGFYGRQDLPVLTLQGGTLFLGDGFNNASGAAIPVGLSAADVATVVNGAPGFLGATTGGYLAFLRSLSTGAPTIASPLTTLSQAANGVLGTPICIDPTGINAAGTVACSINGIVDLDYTARQKVLGFTFSRDMGDFKWLRFGPKNTSPSMRFEASYEFNKKFNRSRVAGPATGTIPLGEALGLFPAGTAFPLNGVTATGSNSLAQLQADAITDSDVLSTMIGFDYPLWVPGWDTQEKSIFTSFQFFNIHTFDADEGLLVQAPYAFSEVAEDHQFVTLLWSAPLHQQRLVLEGLFIRDFDQQGTFYRQRIDFNYFGKSWRPRIEAMIFDGGAETAPIGIYDDKDFVEFSLTYQF